MIRRVIAAVLAVLLAAIGVYLVLRYANSADQRALEGMETDNVYVAVEPISSGTSANNLGDSVETRAVPRQFQVEGAVTDLDDLEGRLVVTDLAAGEQLQEDRFATAEDLRAREAFEVPEEAADLHQLTVPLNTARALGGNIAAGDTVGVFMSFEAEFQRGLYVDADGEVRWLEDLPTEAQTGGAESGEDSLSIALTQLALEKVLVLRVEGGFVPEPAVVAAAQESGDGEVPRTEDEDTGPAEEILVTLALSGGDAERLVYAMEFGTVWLTYEPESAELDDEDVKVVQLPDRAGDVLQ